MDVLGVRDGELMESITKQAAELGIADAAIVALIGAVDSFTVSSTPPTRASERRFASASRSATVRTRIDLGEVAAFFSQFPETVPSDVPKLLDAEMVKVLEDAAA